jgi:surface polysaccharide O-acyltransferase-like enzyme
MSDIEGTLAVASRPPATTDSVALEESRRIQTLRGLACLLLVAFHVIGSHSESGLHAGEHSVYRGFANLFVHVRIPLFTFLSGFVYAYRPVLTGQHGRFARKKLTRLLLPLLCVSTLYFAAALLQPEATGRLPLEDAWRIYFFPYVHFWFLQAVMVIFAIVLLLERLRLLATPGRYVSILAVFVLIHLSVNMEDAEYAPFSLIHAGYLAPFFLLGLGANRFRGIFTLRPVVWASVTLFVIAMGAHAAGIWLGQGASERGTVLGLVIGMTSALALLQLFPRLRLLEVLGAYSFTVYLFHPFFVGASRSALKLFSQPSTEVLFTVGLLAGLAGPPILERALGRFPLANRWLFGQSNAAISPTISTQTRPSSPA